MMYKAIVNPLLRNCGECHIFQAKTREIYTKGNP